MFVKLSGAVTRNDALATLKHTLRFLYMEPLSGEMMAGEYMDLDCESSANGVPAIQVEMYHTAPYLNFLPLPAHAAGNKYWNRGIERGNGNDNVPRPR